MREKLAIAARERGRLGSFLRLAAGPVLRGAASVVDFLIEDACVLCGRPSRPRRFPDPRLRGPVGQLLAPVDQPLLSGRFHVVNHPVCVRCAAGFDTARDPGLLGWFTAEAGVETRRGERFAVGGGAVAPSGADADAPIPIRVVSPFMTNDNVLQLIHLLKFGGYRALAGPMGRAIGAAANAIGLDRADGGDARPATAAAGVTTGVRGA
ncbi:MAG: hypothetical protein P8181_04150, partial [bacterium]